ncbi:DUF3131 domain-containing protein [Vibrio stylophorae]|nr:DUF3131 domain-containing protein [Vibrio stylophorae]
MRKLLWVTLLYSLVGCGVLVEQVQDGMSAIERSQLIRQGRHGALTAQELQWAKIAWRYFENNTQTQTGLVNTVDRYPTFTMSGLADYLAALTAAHQFGFIDDKQHDERLTKVMTFLNEMALTQAGVPNKVYNASTGQMVDYGNQPGEVGWSALDIGRLLIWLAITKQRYPHFSEYIDKAVLRWNFCMLTGEDGLLYGGSIHQGKISPYKEGRLGAEEYAAYGYLDWNIVPYRAMSLEPYESITFYGIDLLFDGRDPRYYDVLRPVLATPYWQLGLEFNWDQIDDHDSQDSYHSAAQLAQIAESVYQIQEQRWRHERIYTARAEHILSKPPYFVYDTLYALGSPWATLADDGQFYPSAALVSTRAVFQMWALWDTEYTDQLMLLVQSLYQADRGWYEGRYEHSSAYEKSISLQTNTAVLTALLYKQQGKLYQRAQSKEYRDVRRFNRFNHPGQCHAKGFE